MILVFNAGSSTLKHALFDDGAATEISSGVVEVSPQPDGHRQAALATLASLAGRPIRAVGHRVVHGGDAFEETIRIDEGVRAALQRLRDLAPLHNPPALAVIEAVSEELPAIAQCAAFDTAFFAGLPAVARTYPVPWKWTEAWGVRRFGFHGLSHAYCAGRAGELLGRPPRRLVICHLGNGCSAAGVFDGSPIATTMGFTPMEGLMMGRRSGSIDPGILLWVGRRQGLSFDAIDDALNNRSGLLGVSGVSSDYREVERAAEDGSDRARLALDLFADRLRGAIGSLAAGLGGLDALVFTAGIGENSARLREEACRNLAFLGVRLDAAANGACRPDADVSDSSSPARVLVVHTREELEVARGVKTLLLDSRTSST